MKILNLLTSGSIGGIESLCRDIGEISCFDNGYCFLFEGGIIYEQMREKGLVTYCLKDNYGKLSVNKLKKLLEIASNYDIIVVHHGDPFLKLYFYLLTKKINKKFVTVVHSCYEDEYFYPDNIVKKYLAKCIYQISMSKSDRILFVSEAGKKTYEEVFRIAQEKKQVVYNGVGIDKLKAGENLLISKPEKYNITYIGRLDRVKGVNLLIDSVGKLTKKIPVHLSIIGDGNIRAELEHQINLLGIQSVITFYGKQTDIIPFLKNTDIFVYPSVWQEVFGISVIEAMAFGKICIANRVGGLSEIINDGVNGFLTKEVSSEGILEAIERAIQSYKDNTFYNISKEARKTAEKFSIVNTVENLNQIYKTL